MRALLVLLATLLVSSPPVFAQTDVELPYRPWQAGEPLTDPTLPPRDESRPLLVGPEYARREFAPELGVGKMPLECLIARDCSAHTAFATMAWRATPHFAWRLVGERTRLARQRLHYVGVGVRVFALGNGRLDPFLGLTLGGEHLAARHALRLAGELSFGSYWYVWERLKLGLVLKFRQAEPRLGSCAARDGTCRHRSLLGERWLASGVSVELPLGDLH